MGRMMRVYEVLPVLFEQKAQLSKGISGVAGKVVNTPRVIVNGYHSPGHYSSAPSLCIDNYNYITELRTLSADHAPWITQLWCSDGNYHYVQPVAVVLRVGVHR